MAVLALPGLAGLLQEQDSLTSHGHRLLAWVTEPLGQRFQMAPAPVVTTRYCPLSYCGPGCQIYLGRLSPDPVAVSTEMPSKGWAGETTLSSQPQQSCPSRARLELAVLLGCESAELLPSAPLWYSQL
ncbi:hypothetical protein KIL84_020756 [Mauremys mutica]|uniref:Uncharacterized protein n=1 Tax=Mauremys mutica TaxID=74926 RepID=A0A9D4ATT8_9SAUR|nr:hypothetical protein KIL84_020756 [Mauremys mutica]